MGTTVGRSLPRPSRPDRRLEDLASVGGPPLTTRQLAQMIGMSATFIREEIRSGHLRAVLLGRGRKRVFRIPVHEARRYAKELGLI
jgi:excisionase family DNA binding protein